MTRLLVFNQDVGGFRFLAPLLHRLRQNMGELSVIHACQPRLREQTARLADGALILGLPADGVFTPSDWSQLLRSNEIAAVLCTHGNPRRPGSTTAGLIMAARGLGCPTLGFLDHWKWPERFLDDGGNPTFAPDQLGVIDASHLAAVAALGIAPGRLSIVGHPVLEDVAAVPTTPAQPLRMVLVSEIDPRRPGTGIFAKSQLLDRLKAQSSSLHLDFRYRPHPNEDPACLPARLAIDATPWPEILDAFDVFLGHESMLLLEAAFHGRVAVRLPTPADVLPSSMPFSFGLGLEDVASLPSLLTRIQKGERGQMPALDVVGSLQRCHDLFCRFISSLDSCRERRSSL